MADNNVEEVDRLSQLPEDPLLHILSFLPTKIAARTSLLAPPFRHLWKISPSFELDRSDFPPDFRFDDVTSYLDNRVSASTTPPQVSASTTPPQVSASTTSPRVSASTTSPRVSASTTSPQVSASTVSDKLLSFCLKAKRIPFSIELISNWLNSAHLLGLRHLSLHIHAKTIESLFPLILSFGSLHSLSIDSVDSDMNYLNRPRIKARMFESGLKTLIMEQRNLEYLCITYPAGYDVDLYSQSVKTLKLSTKCRARKIYLSFSKLEFLDLSICLSRETKQFHGDMPVLRKALVDTFPLWEENVPVLRDILKSITNVSELTLRIVTPNPEIRLEKPTSSDLCHPLVEPGGDMPVFPNLRSLKLSMCCYENALQDLICVLQHSPCIDSVHLIHVEGPSSKQECWAREAWDSKLPLNSEGNRKYAHFSNLQTGDKKNEVIKLLSGENSSKRRKI